MTLRLTARQRAYVERFVRCGDAYASALDAGYGRKRLRQAVYDLRRNPKVQAEITRRQTPDLDRIVAKASDVTNEFLLATLTEALGDIQRTGSTGSAMTANKLRAIELVVRVKELQAKDATEEPARPYENLNEAELDAKIAELGAQLGLVKAAAPPEPDPDPIPDPPDAPWKTTAPANPPSPPNPNLPSLDDVQPKRPCAHDSSHPPYRAKWLAGSRGRAGRFEECPACRGIWADANHAEARRWNQSLLPADPR